jgi:CO/xanthine dehydrogenase FAD-binding subunit
VKPPAFEYAAPTDIGEVLALLEQHGDDSKVLAGGQSLVPLLNFRLAAPAVLVDINGVGSLSHIRRRDGALHIGALTRQATAEGSPLVAEHWPLLVEALEHVAHPQIRNRGTVGGSLAHADATAELPVACAALDARFHIRSSRGSRSVGWQDFFVTHLTTALAADELLVEVELPALPPNAGWAFTEYARRHGDFALGGAAVIVARDGDVCREARIALLGASDKPVRCTAAERALVGARIDAATAAEAARLAVAGVAPTGDLHGSTDYRREVIAAMVRRGVLQAGERSGG